MSVSELTYRQVALEDPEGRWELHCGELRRKPDMSIEHNALATELLVALRPQLNRTEFDVRVNMGHVRVTGQSYFIPDAYVIPVAYQRQLWGTHELESYSEPLPLVVEIWSPSTGDFDVAVKLRSYQDRGDREIWRLHPYEHTLLSSQRQPDGAYRQVTYTGGLVNPIALPGVAVDLDALFRLNRPEEQP